MSGYHDKNSKVAGLWTIIECVSLSGSSEVAGIEGTSFLLTESGDVEWNIKGGCQNLPLFECHMFEVYTYQNIQCYAKRTLLRFAAYKGHIIEFRLDQPVMSEDLMLLTYDGWFMLQCEKSNLPALERTLPFTLLSAMQDEYFVDLFITSKSGKLLPCHSIVLKAMMPGFDWSRSAEHHLKQLFLDDEVLDVLMHYLYTDALPRDISFSVAKQCITATESIGDLQDFRSKCFVYARNIYLRNKIVKIVNEVHENLKAVAQSVRNAQELEARPYIIRKLKGGLVPLSIALIKVIEMCQEFEVMCTWLTNKEQKKVIEYIRAHSPLVIQEITLIMKEVLALLNLFTPQTRLEFAQQFVPEIHTALHLIVFDVASLRNCLEQIIQVSSFSSDVAQSPLKGHSLVNTLENDLHLRELQRLRILQENLTSLTNSLLSKTEQFEEVEIRMRNRGIARMLESLEGELPELILRFNEFAGAMDDIFDWSEFKFVFKGGTSKLERIVSKLAKHSDVVDRFIQDIVDMINNEIFTASVINLGFVLAKDKSADVVGDTTQNSSSLPSDLMNFFQSSTKGMSEDSKSDDICGGISGSGRPRSQELSTIPLNDCSVEDNYGTFSTNENIPQLKNRLAKKTQKVKCRNELIDGESCSSSSSYGAEKIDSPHEINLENISEDVALDPKLEEEAKKLNLTDRVCEIPYATRSKLAQSLVAMLSSQEMVDFTFCIIPPSEEDECSNSSVDLSEDSIAVELDKFEGSSTDDKSQLPNSGSQPVIDNLINIEEEEPHFGLLDCHQSCKGNEDSLEVQGDIEPRSVKKINPLSQRVLHQSENETSSSVLKFPFTSSKFSRNKKLKKSLSLEQGSSLREECSSSETSRDQSLLKKCQFSSNQSVSLDSEALDFVSGVNSIPLASAAVESNVPCKSSSVCEDIDQILKMKHLNLSETYETSSLFDASKVGVEMKAHRVVIATQCEWFRRALLSGMKEAIDRYIEVPGCSVAIFKMFLHYLYTGEMDAASLATDQLVDFLVLVDHYGVDSLKAIVEEELETRVEDETAVPLLMVAYHCNINKLKDLCLHHCALRRHYELLHQVPPDLRQQLVAAILNLKKWNKLGMDQFDRTEAFGLTEERQMMDSETHFDPLIDEELSSLLYNMQDSSSSSEEGFGPSKNKR